MTYVQRHNDSRQNVPLRRPRAQKQQYKRHIDKDDIGVIEAMLSAFNYIPVGRTSIYKNFKDDAGWCELQNYQVMALDNASFDMFGREFNERCITFNLNGGLKGKMILGHRIFMYGCNQTISILQPIEQIGTWYSEYPYFRPGDNYVIEGLMAGLDRKAKDLELMSLPWMTDELFKLHKKMKGFDHSYDYSDDGNYWRNASARHKEISNEVRNSGHAKELLELAPEFKIIG